MANLILILIYLVSMTSTAFAKTTVTVNGQEIDANGKRVIIDDDDRGSRQVEIEEDRPARTVVIEEHTVIDEDVPLRRGDFEGEVISVDRHRGQVVVRYVDTVERRLEASRSNIAHLKMGDEVRVYMRPGDDNEAWKVVKIAN